MADDVVLGKVNSIQNCLQRIHDVVGNDANKINDINVQDIVVLNLQRAVQLCIDLASYIISVKNLGLPKTLKESFLILQKNNILPQPLTKKMCKMVEFGNIACHDYKALDIEIVKSIVTKNLAEFEEFYAIIVSFMNT